MKKPLLALGGVVGLLAAGLLAYSQTAAFAWDEGFHLLAAQLIKHGKRPYLDFCFPQTPLNAYWNAFGMRVFGESWHTAHALAAAATAAAIFLSAQFLLQRFPVPEWRLTAAITAALAIGLNAIVLYFGTIGQAYGLCLLLIVAAFRLAIVAVDRTNPLAAGYAGLLAGAAAASSLLTAPIAPVLLIWIWIYNRHGSRAVKWIAFLAGSAIAFLPVLWLFAKSPALVRFNIIDYHLLYRQVQWTGAIQHDLEVMASWIDSSQALLTVLLAVGGLLFVAHRSQWDRQRRAEFYLCGWLGLALLVHICNAHPTFPQYFILVIPFMAILASAGLYAIGSRMYAPDRPFWPTLVFAVLLSIGLAKSLYEERDDFTWHDMQAIAAKVEQVTPAHAPLLADEAVYFLTRRPPPSGMELRDSHKLEFAPAFAAYVHIVTGTEFARQIGSKIYDTVETCADDEKVEALGLPRLYSQKAEIDDCKVFWEKTR